MRIRKRADTCLSAGKQAPVYLVTCLHGGSPSWSRQVDKLKVTSAISILPFYCQSIHKFIPFFLPSLAPSLANASMHLCIRSTISSFIRPPSIHPPIYLSVQSTIESVVMSADNGSYRVSSRHNISDITSIHSSSINQSMHSSSINAFIHQSIKCPVHQCIHSFKFMDFRNELNSELFFGFLINNFPFCLSNISIRR